MRKQINLYLSTTHLSEIDAAVAALNSSRPEGAPPWSRSGFLVHAALQRARRIDASLPQGTGHRENDRQGAALAPRETRK